MSQRGNSVGFEQLESRKLFAADACQMMPASALERIDAASHLHASPQVTNTTPIGYTPAQMRHAYGFDNISFASGTIAGDGRGQTIAIVDAYDDPNIAADLAQFSTQFGL